jgi:hypothetical protein
MNLRQAAEMALKALEICHQTDALVETHQPVL